MDFNTIFVFSGLFRDKKLGGIENILYFCGQLNNPSANNILKVFAREV